MGLEEGHAAVLVEGDLLDVDAGHVHVGGHDAHTVVDGLRAHAEQVQVAAAVVVVVLTARSQGHTEGVGNVALLFGHGDGDGDGLALGLGVVQVLHVAGGVVVGGPDGGLVSLLVEVDLLVAEAGFQLGGDVGVVGVRHDFYPRFFSFRWFEMQDVAFCIYFAYSLSYISHASVTRLTNCLVSLKGIRFSPPSPSA